MGQVLEVLEALQEFKCCLIFHKKHQRLSDKETYWAFPENARKFAKKKRSFWADGRGACYSIFCAIYENKAVKSYFMDVSQANFYAKLCMKLGAYEKKNVKLFRNNVYEIP